MQPNHGSLQMCAIDDIADHNTTQQPGSDGRKQGAVTVKMHTMASHFSLEVFSFVITAGTKV